jgi:hypothetical protein
MGYLAAGMTGIGEDTPPGGAAGSISSTLPGAGVGHNRLTEGHGVVNPTVRRNLRDSLVQVEQ